MKKRLLIVLLAAVLTLGLTACSSKETTQTGNNSGGKTVVTALFATELPEFEALVEATFDDIDLQIERSTSGGYNSDILRRLRNGHGKDLIFTTMPNGEIADYVMDLSANSFSTKFASSVMSIIEKNGTTAWLPMPSVYKGLIVNKTLAEDLGKGLPASQQELLELLAAAKAAGVGMDAEGYTFAVANVDGVSVGEMIISTMVPDFLGTMEGERWTNAFVEKTAAAAGTLEEHLAFLISLGAEGHMDPTRNHPGITWRNAVPLAERMIAREMTAGYGYSDVLYELRAANTGDEFVMIPFLSAKGNQPWVTTTPSAYLGANAEVQQDAAKLDAVLRILELFATPEGQAAIIRDTQSDSSYLTEPVEGSGSSSGLEHYVEAGYVYNLDRFNSDMLWLLGSNIIKVCAGRMELDEALAAVDDLNQNGAASYADDFTLIGSVENDLLYENFNTRKEETTLGNLITDAIAELAGVDIAFANGGSIRASLYAGDVYTSDLAEVCPYTTTTIVTLEVTGETIYQMLENSIQGIYYQSIPAGRFLQVSGLRYTISVDPSVEDVSNELNRKPAAAALLEVTLPDGAPLDREATYRIAANNYMCGSSGYIEAGDGYTMLNVFDDLTPAAPGAQLVEDTGKTFADAIVAYFQNHQNENISPALEGRITVQEAGK